MKETKFNLPLLLFLLISIGTSVTCSLIDPYFYSKILGDQNSIIIFITSGIAAYLSIIYINRYDLHFISNAFSKRKLLFYFSISILLGFMPVLIDTWHSFPKDINVLFPESVLFYPTIGVLAEILFHLLPATLLLVIFRSKIRNHPWIIIVSVAAVEPVFQVIFGIGPNGIELRDVLVFLEIFIFGIVQMHAFMKYGFFTMYICRIGFYLTWHFFWGTIRLGIM